MPLLQLIGQIIELTPFWVWGLLAFITLLGARQAFDRELHARTIIGISAGWTVFSIWGAANTFGFNTPVLVAWAMGLALSLAMQHLLVTPRGVTALGGNRFRLAGSLWPLLTIWAVFGVRYVTSVMMLLDPALKQNPSFDLAVPAIYGLLSGLFVGRALRVLRTAPRPGTLALA
ncbi:DUF6622 family protein [Piscinibacter sp. HJYY11]|uniref:DUF6622 family protein n=1 Tax=Piscinibacter sp. HJYY11 TaxID=2801333 RepID=UPI00191F0C0E|nr:DUF6622 family protein [Piscinibacter sp. HJYY11]MBL0727398.1 hypothetical protein [Piscinibacter sp. HJYY11]